MQFCLHFGARSQRLRKQDEMDRGFYERVVKEMREAGVEELGLFYLGESFMCDWLPEAIAYAKDIGFPYVFLSTPMVRCPRPNASRRACEPGSTRSFSL